MSANQYLSPPQFGAQSSGPAPLTPPSSAPTSASSGAPGASVWRANSAFRTGAEKSSS